MRYCYPFHEITNRDVPLFGGKNASLGELTGRLSELGIRVPHGFAVHSDAYLHTLQENGLVAPITAALEKINPETLEGLSDASAECRRLIDGCSIPEAIQQEILLRYAAMGNPSVAVRSSATAEDLPTASFAGQHESYLNITGESALIAAVRNCYRSLFSERAIKYRIDNGFEHMKVEIGRAHV